MKRIECLKALAEITKEDDLVVTNLGNTPSRVVFRKTFESQSVRDEPGTVYARSFGACIGVAEAQSVRSGWRRKFALELGLLLADTAYHKPSNLRIIVFDNEAYESPGGMPTATAHGVDLVQVAKGCGIKKGFTVSSIERIPNKLSILGKMSFALLSRKSRTGTIEGLPIRAWTINSTSIYSRLTSKKRKKAGS